jgi:hypothetical protein
MMSGQSSNPAIKNLVIYIQLLLQVGFLASAPAESTDVKGQPSAPWTQVTEILARIHAPAFQ